MRNRSVAAIGLATVAGLLLSGCSGDPAPAASSSSASPDAEARSGGDIVYAIASDPGCVDPQQVRTTVAYPNQAVDSLTAQDPETGEIVPWLAETWEVSDDATEFTFHLRSGVTFSDGTPLNAESIKENFDGIIELGGRATLSGGYLAGYEGSEVVDDSTVIVRFAEANVPFLQGTATGSLGILSSDTLTKTPEERCQGAIIGSGPFVFTEYTPGSVISFAKREDYAWPSALAEHDGPAYLDTLTFQIVTEGSVRVGGLSTGEFVGFETIPYPQYDQVLGGGYEILKSPNPGNVQGIYTNTESPAVGEPAVRQALQKAIDRVEFRDTLTHPSNDLPISALALGTPGVVDLSADLEYDPEGAAQLLDDAGWVVGDDGIREKDGKKLKLVTLLVSTSSTQAELLQIQANRVGIDFEFEVFANNSEHWDRRAQGNWDYTFSGLTRGDGDTLWNDFRSGRVPPASAAIISADTSPRLDELLDQQRAAVDVDERNELLAEAQQIIVEEGLLVPLTLNYVTHAISPQLHGVKLDASRRAFVWYDAWLDADA